MKRRSAAGCLLADLGTTNQVAVANFYLAPASMQARKLKFKALSMPIGKKYYSVARCALSIL